MHPPHRLVETFMSLLSGRITLRLRSFPVRLLYNAPILWLSSFLTFLHTAQWINPDGTKPNTVIAYDIRAVGLCPNFTLQV